MGSASSVRVLTPPVLPYLLGLGTTTGLDMCNGYLNK